MSPTTTERVQRKFRETAPLFAALGDSTRLGLLLKLGDHGTLSITHLAEGLPLTRQAIRKHLRVLEEAGLIRGVRRGRENLFQVEPRPLKEVRRSLEEISLQWDRALERLKAFVED